MPLVSVVTPCYNAGRFVARTLESVRLQTMTDWEHVVVDDGSTDDSATVVEEFARNDGRVRLIRQPNAGCAAARNRGFRSAAADSPLLLFLDADDCLEPDMLRVMANYLDAHPTVGMAHCGHRFIDAAGGRLGPGTCGVGWPPRYVPHGVGVKELPSNLPETPFSSIYCLAGIIPSLAVIRRSVYERTPGWDESFGQHHEDTDLFLHVALRGEVHHVPQELVCHRRHPGQNTADPRRFGNQAEKLYAKWLEGRELTAEQRSIVEAAEWFRVGRLAPWQGLRAGARHLRAGEFRQAARFYGGAARRYGASFLPRHRQARRLALADGGWVGDVSDSPAPPPRMQRR